MRTLSHFISVRKLIALGMTAAFIYLAIVGKVTPENFLFAYGSIVGFYFGDRKQKQDEKLE